MNWVTLVTKLPLVIQATMQIVENIKTASGAQKKEAVIAAIPEGVGLVEFAAGKDLLNDPTIMELIGVYIDAEKAAMRAKAALSAGILAKQPPA